MASFIFIVAGLNLALGYALALYLGPELHSSLFGPPTPVPVGGGGSLAVEEPPVGPVAVATNEPSAAQEEEAEPGPAAAAPVALGPVAPPAATVETADVETAQAKPAEQPELVGELIDQFKGDLHNYREQLAAVDKQIRSGAPSKDVAAMQACLADLFAANARYMAQQDDAGSRLQRRCEAAEEHVLIGRQLESAFEQQAQQVRGANDNLEQINAADNSPQDCQRIVTETARLIDASNSLRDTLDDVGLRLAGQEVRRQSQATGEDELPAKLVSRTELEAALAECWQTESAQGGALSLGLVDLDACRELNEAQGMQNVDRVLSTVGRVVCGSLQGQQLTARLNGEKFLVLFPGRNGRESTGTLELIRQQVETTHFQAGANQFETSVSCAAVEMVSGDNFDSVLERLQVTLNEAKSCGRNRTFFHDGKFPTPVVPPILSLQSRTQEI